MPTTPNYGWNTPVVNGDFGAWGGILNAAFVEIDADMNTLAVALSTTNSTLSSLAATVASNALNVAKTNQNNTFSGTQTFNAVAATTVATTGDIASAANVNARGLSVVDRSASLGSLTGLAYFSPAYAVAGSDDLYLQIAGNASATPANRFMRIQVGDNTQVRKLGIMTNQTYIGPNGPTPEFIGGESLRVGGSLQVDAAVNAAQFNGAGTGLLAGTVPSAAVFGLDSFKTGTTNSITLLDVGKSNVGHTHTTSDIAALNTILDNKAALVHNHDASAITTGLLPWTRIADAPRINFTSSATEAFSFVTGQVSNGGGAAPPAMTRPDALPVANWRWVKVAFPDAVQAYIPMLFTANL